MIAESFEISSAASFTAWLYRPLLDLQWNDAGPLHLYKVEFAIGDLADGRAGDYTLQRSLPPSLRAELLRQTGLAPYDVRDPRDLPAGLQTERWRLLCEQIDSYPRLNAARRRLVLRVLSALCLYEFVVELTDQYPAVNQSADVNEAMIGYMRACARYLLHLDYGTPYDIGCFQQIAEEGPRRSLVRANALLHMIVQSARDAHDVDAVTHWRAIAFDEIMAMEGSLEPFGHELILSRYYRAASFAPQMLGQPDRVVAEMEMCEQLGRGLQPANPREEIIKAENLHPLLQSRGKEAIWLGDLGLAEQRAREVVDIDPLDPRAHIELGDILAKRDSFAESAQHYVIAGQLGPPGTAIAWFMAGQCFEKLGDIARACDCHLKASQSDPLGLSPLKSLGRIAATTEQPILGIWADTRLGELTALSTATRANND